MKLVVLHNIASSDYKNVLFSELYKKHQNMKIIHFAETESIRKWKIRYNELQYPYKVLYKGRLGATNPVAISFKTIKELEKENPDVVYLGGYSYLAQWFALIWAKIKKKKAIIEMDTNKWDKKRFFLKELVKKFFIRFCDLGLVYSESNREYLIELGMTPKKILKKPNVTNSRVFNCAKTLKKPDEFTYPYNILYVGRLSPEKNLLFTIESFGGACKTIRSNNWGFIIIGNGPLEKTIEDFIKKRKISNISLVKFKQREELVSYYCYSNIFILPSISEPWGIVINEAMAAGLPVIVSNRCGSAYEIVKHGENGFIIDPYNKKKLVGLLQDIICNKYNLKNMGEKSKEIIKDFTPEVAAAVIVKAMEAVK